MNFIKIKIIFFAFFFLQIAIPISQLAAQKDMVLLETKEQQQAPFTLDDLPSLDELPEWIPEDIKSWANWGNIVFSIFVLLFGYFEELIPWLKDRINEKALRIFAFAAVMLIAFISLGWSTFSGLAVSFLFSTGFLYDIILKGLLNKKSKEVMNPYKEKLGIASLPESCTTCVCKKK